MDTCGNRIAVNSIYWGLISNLWCVFPAALLTGLALTFLGVILAALLYYKLINRRNKHFMRSRVLREGLIRHIESKADELGKSHDVVSDLSTMRMIHSELNNEEGDKSAGLYAILSIIVPFVSLYVMYFLTKRLRNT